MFNQRKKSEPQREPGIDNDDFRAVLQQVVAGVRLEEADDHVSPCFSIYYILYACVYITIACASM